MKAMILAAGLGTRMRPLTDNLPKPLLPLGDSTIIEQHLYKLADIGISEVVINTCYLAEKIEQHLGTGEAFGLKINYSKETTPLETAGGIKHALTLLGSEPFLLLNGDIWSDMPLAVLKKQAKNLGDRLAHLVLVDNPAHHTLGDFSIDAQGSVIIQKDLAKLTYSGMSVISPKLFDYEIDANLLADYLFKAVEYSLVSAEYYQGYWVDIGTPERLAILQKKLEYAQ